MGGTRPLRLEARRIRRDKPATRLNKFCMFGGNTAVGTSGVINLIRVCLSVLPLLLLLLLLLVFRLLQSNFPAL